MTFKKKTNWNEYYKKSSFVASFTRKITQNYIINYLKKFFSSNETFLIQEMGGANSCFLKGIIKKYPECKYSILDNSEEGIRVSKKNFSSYENVVVNNIDLLKENKIIESDVVISAGLIEHFDIENTALMIKKHFQYTKSEGLVIMTYPTPTLIYRISRKLMEILSIWQFHDERPLRMKEVANIASKYGFIIDHKINRFIPLSQGLICCKKFKLNK